MVIHVILQFIIFLNKKLHLINWTKITVWTINCSQTCNNVVDRVITSNRTNKITQKITLLTTLTTKFVVISIS